MLSPTGRTLTPDWLDRFQALDAGPKNPKGSPPSKKLSMLLRAAFWAPPGKTLVWGDWSAIEARVLPWLADSPGGEKVLDIFRTNDKDPALPDIYKLTAGKLLNKDPVDVTGDERQAYGKVPVLSLGFGGALGALQAMATNYGVYLDTATGQRVVDGWREENQWARDFWGQHGRRGSYGLWGAANSAIESPDAIFPAGRVAYVFDRKYLGGTLFCALPCGRLLTYPGIKWSHRVVKDKKTKQEKEVFDLSYIKGYGRVGAWYGKFAENITQATAASILRRTLKRLDPETETGFDWWWSQGFDPRKENFMPVVMHTHDEDIMEVDEDKAGAAKLFLQKTMEANDAWDEGLPLKAEITSNFYYSKAVK